MVYHASIVMLLAGFLHAFSLQVYKNYGEHLTVSDLPRGRESEEKSTSLFLHGWGYSYIVPICSRRRNRRKAVASIPLGKSNG